MQKEKPVFEAIPNWPTNSLEGLQDPALRWIKIRADLVAAASTTPTISATAAAIAAGTAAAIGRTS
jgi:hypothetical protein